MTLIVVNIYQFYYIFLYLFVDYTIDENTLNINIIKVFVKEKILIDDIECYSRKKRKK